MAIREVIQIGDPRLKALNKTIEKFNDPLVEQVIQDLIETMRAKELIGMAPHRLVKTGKCL